MLKYKADLISLVYMLVTTSALVVHWNLADFNIFLFLLSVTMAAACFAMSHNHKHLPMWKNRFLNHLTDHWLTLFYGYPVFAWVPTHNLNHHKYANQAEDYTKTYRFSNKNNFFTFIAYPFISAYYQSEPIKKYLKKQFGNNRSKFFYCISQYLVLAAYLCILFYLDAEKAFVYAVIPQLFSLIFVLMVNYMQHVHTDQNSEYDHSRNFVGLGSKFLLNNGLHTIHHEDMSLHWSKLPKAHTKIKDNIHPALIERSLAWYIFRTYILSLFIPAWRSKPIQEILKQT